MGINIKYTNLNTIADSFQFMFLQCFLSLNNNKCLEIVLTFTHKDKIPQPKNDLYLIYCCFEIGGSYDNLSWHPCFLDDVT